MDQRYDPRLAAWLDAWLAGMRSAGYSRAYVRIVDSPYPEMLRIGWESDPAALFVPQVTDHGADDGWSTAIRIFVAIDEMRPNYVLQTPIVGMILAGEIPLP